MSLYFVLGMAYATWWMLNHRDYVQQSISEAESELERPVSNWMKSLLLAVMMLAVSTCWPIRFYYDFVEA